MAGAVLFERHPFDLVVRWRTVAKELSIGLVVRKCFRCSAECIEGSLGVHPGLGHPVARLGLEIGISPQEVSDFHLDGLCEQGMRSVAQNLSERIGEGPWLSQLVGCGVSLLWWRSGGVEHPHNTPPYPFMPSPTSANSSLTCLLNQIHSGACHSISSSVGK
jgi:hypothetical protein